MRFEKNCFGQLSGYLLTNACCFKDKENAVIDLIEVGSEKVKNKMDLSVELEKKLREERMVMDELDMQLQCVRYSVQNNDWLQLNK